MKGLYERFYKVIRRVPRGRVATYGQIARAAGLPRHARHVGFALAALEDPKVPWQRVLNASGRVSRRDHPDAAARQRAMLEREGVKFGASGAVLLARYQWKAGRAPLGV